MAIAEPGRYACEPKIDGVRGLVVYGPDGSLETRNRSGIRRDWLRGDAFEGGLRRLGNRLPILWNGTVLDGELTTGTFRTTMAALFGSKMHRADLRLVVFDVPVLAGLDLRTLPWQERRDRLELLAQAFEVPLELSPVIEPTRDLAVDMVDGRLEGIVLKDPDLALPRRQPRRLAQGQGPIMVRARSLALRPALGTINLFGRSPHGETRCEAARQTSDQVLRSPGEGAIRQGEEGIRQLPNPGRGPRDQRQAAVGEAAQGRQSQQGRVRAHQSQGR
jgi:hypothetical protein